MNVLSRALCWNRNRPGLAGVSVVQWPCVPSLGHTWLCQGLLLLVPRFPRSAHLAGLAKCGKRCASIFRLPL